MTTHPNAQEDKRRALANCDAIQKVHPDLECVLNTIRDALKDVTNGNSREFTKTRKEVVEDALTKIL